MRAISKNTRKATAITLAAALVIAVYLNWQYARTGVTLEEDAVNVSAVSQETVPVTDELMTEAEAVSSANKNYGEAQLVSVANNSGSKFFEEARLKRTKAHDEAMDSIQKALKSASLSTEEKKEYTSQLTGNLADLNAENEIETLVKAKGFADCLCFLQAGRADLTVMTWWGCVLFWCAVWVWFGARTLRAANRVLACQQFGCACLHAARLGQSLERLQRR